MCGIFGYSVSSNKQLSYTKRVALTSILQTLNDGRGGDSWGYYALDKSGEIKLNHGIGEIIRVPSRELAIHRVIMAHTRKATTGGVSEENCHPFDIKNIIGAHNGMISNHAELNKKYERKFAVDSMHIFGHIADNLPINELEGYGAIEYIDKKAPDRVHLAKLRHGQLSIVGIGKGPEDVHGIVWSSDESHLEKALSCAGVTSFEYELEEGSLYFAWNGNLYKTEKKLEFKTKTYSSSEFSRTGYNTGGGSCSNSWNRGKNVDYEDDNDFMAYLGQRYGSSVSQPAATIINPPLLPAANGSAQSGVSKSDDNNSVAQKPASSGIKNNEAQEVEISNLTQSSTDDLQTVEDENIIVDVDVNNSDNFRQKVADLTTTNPNKP